MLKPTTTEAYHKQLSQAIQRSYCRLQQSYRAKPKMMLQPAYNNRGNAAKHHLKQYKEAIADYDKAIELNPEDEAYNNR